MWQDAVNARKMTVVIHADIVTWYVILRVPLFVMCDPTVTEVI